MDPLHLPLLLAQVGLLMLLLTIVMLADGKAAVGVPEKITWVSTDQPNERTFGLIGLVASIWAVLRRTMG